MNAFIKHELIVHRLIVGMKHLDHWADAQEGHSNLSNTHAVGNRPDRWLQDFSVQSDEYTEEVECLQQIHLITEFIGHYFAYAFELFFRSSLFSILWIEFFSSVNVRHFNKEDSDE